MKIGCMVWRIPGLDLDFWEQIDWIKEQEFEEISFHTCRYLGGGQGLDPRQADKAVIDRLKKRLAGFGAIDIHAPFDNYDVSLISPNPLIRKASLETLKETIRLAADIGAETVTFHTGSSGAGPTREEQRKYLAESVIELNKTASDLGVKLGAELTADYQVLIETKVSKVGLTVDVGHVSFDDGAGYREFGSIGGLIRHFSARIFHLHIHDYDGQTDHLALGKGKIDFNDIIISLREIGYSGSLCLELNPDRVSIKDILESRDKLRKLIQNSI